jgi:hypothetical protein
VEKNTVQAEYLDSLSHETTEFTCLSSEPVFEVGDLISKKNNQFSFVHSPFGLGGELELPNILQNPLEGWLRRNAHGSISVQDRHLPR